MKLAIALLILGATLIGYALSLSPYKDKELFMERYMSMSAGQSEEYSKLREEMLTPKFQLEDYGVTLIAAAVIVSLTMRKGRLYLMSPKSRKTLLAIAIGLPFFTVGGYVFDLFLAFERGEFPHWADSMGIPLMGTPFLLVLLLVWSLVHLSLLHGTNHSAAPLVLALSLRVTNCWLLFLSAATTALLLLCIVAGQYWYAIPSVLWLYYYLSIGAVWRVANGA